MLVRGINGVRVGGRNGVRVGSQSASPSQAAKPIPPGEGRWALAAGCWGTLGAASVAAALVAEREVAVSTAGIAVGVADAVGGSGVIVAVGIGVGVGVAVCTGDGL